MRDWLIPVALIHLTGIVLRSCVNLRSRRPRWDGWGAEMDGVGATSPVLKNKRKLSAAPRFVPSLLARKHHRPAQGFALTLQLQASLLEYWAATRRRVPRAIRAGAALSLGEACNLRISPEQKT